MGLRCGRPTMICPFFGDQFFWASIVVDAGVGVAPVSALQLDAEVGSMEVPRSQDLLPPNKRNKKKRKQKC
jgi:UDP:flavonoid glycosyltransferase YjiC (YdhE family)